MHSLGSFRALAAPGRISKRDPQFPLLRSCIALKISLVFITTLGGSEVNRCGSIRLGGGRPSQEGSRWYAPKSLAGRRGFTLLDLIVSISIVTLLMAILIPALAGTRETARRVSCASNQRQIGLSMAMYADDHEEFMPPSIFLRPGGNFLPLNEMMTLRLSDNDMAQPRNRLSPGGWDGLGYLIGYSYLPAPKVFYCPSHRGNHPYSRYRDEFKLWNHSGQRTVGNYHYRGLGPNGTPMLWSISPSGASLVSDGLKTQSDINHNDGVNVLRADLGVFWFSDDTRELVPSLAATESQDQQDAAMASAAVRNAWTLFDRRQGQRYERDPGEPNGRRRAN